MHIVIRNGAQISYLETMSLIAVSDITIVDYAPRVSNPGVKKLLPTRLTPKHIRFQVSGVSNAISNAIRRTVCTELLVSALHVEYADIKTTDMFHIPEMIMKRISMIPVDQKCPLDATFALNVVNTTPMLIDVKSSQIRIVSAGKGTPQRPKLTSAPINETFTLFTLEPGQSIKIDNIGIHQDYGYQPGYGAYVVACNAVSIALDQKPKDMYGVDDPKAISVSMSDPRKWEIAFTTNGTLPPKEIVVAACNNIINRVQLVSDMLSDIRSSGNEYILVIEGESDTIGNLFMKSICELFPDIIAVIYKAPSHDRTCTIRIICDEDVNVVFDTAIKYIVKSFTQIRGFFE